MQINLWMIRRIYFLQNNIITYNKKNNKIKLKHFFEI